MRGTIEVERDSDKEKVIAAAKLLDNVARQLTETEPKKSLLYQIGL